MARSSFTLIHSLLSVLGRVELAGTLARMSSHGSCWRRSSWAPLASPQRSSAAPAAALSLDFGGFGP